jgi:hypothetical protein
VLKVDGRNHIVAVVDVSVGGAYLATRAQVTPARSLCLTLRLPSGVELLLTCEIVRVSQQTDESQGHPRGIAVRFQVQYQNLFNHPNWGNPNTNIASGPSFGQITGTRNNMRNLQFALKYSF